MNVRLSILLALLLFSSACSSSGTRFTGMWLNEDYEGAVLDDVLVIAVAESETNRRMYESELVAQLKSRGVNAVPSYTSLPSKEMLTKEEVEAVLQDSKIKVKIKKTVI